MSDAAPAPAAPHRRALRRRARRTLGLAVALVLGAHALGWALLECFPNVRDSRYAPRAELLERRIGRGPDRPFALVMLGSSRTQWGFAPRAAEAALADELGRPAVAFNFGVQGTGPLAHDLYLRRLLATGPRPDAVYLEVNPLMLFAENGRPRDLAGGALDPRALWWDDLDVLAGHGAGRPDVRAEWVAVRVKSLARYRFQFLWRVLPAWVPYYHAPHHDLPRDEWGWNPLSAELGADVLGVRRETAARSFGPCLAEGDVHPAAVAALRSIAALCREHRIALTLVIMPEGPSFRALYSPRAEANWRAAIDGLRAEFGVPVVDAREWVGEDGFGDGHHLLPSGALEFSRRLADEAVRAHARRWRTDRAAR